MITEQEMKKLEKEYRQGKSTLTDEEWDKMVKETGYKESVGESGLVEDKDKSLNGRNLVEMKTPLISLNKVNKKENLMLFFKQNKQEEYIMEPKLDGNAFNAIYLVGEDGTAKFACLGSSGTGLKSIECFPDAFKFVKKVGLPDYIDKETVSKLNSLGYVIDNRIELRGESIINRESWTKLNSQYIKGNESWRGIVTGIMGRKIPSSLVYIISNLEDGEINFNDKKSKDMKLLKKYGLDIDLQNYMKENNIKKFVVETICKETGEKTIKANEIYILPNLKPTSSKITAYKEEVCFFTYAMSSKDGNKDDHSIISAIPGVLCFDEVDFNDLINLCKQGDKDVIKGLSTTSVRFKYDDIKKVIEYIGFFFGDKEWCSYATKEHRKLGSFICDGIVIKTTDADAGVMRTGRLAHHPTNRVAVKLLGKKYRTRLLRIENNITELGNNTVRGIIETIETDEGSKVSNVNLHNPSWLKRNTWIKEGIEVDVVMSADLIPILYEVK